MMDKRVLEARRICITGLEGCGKSSGLFELLKEEATTKRPVLFVYQTYALMEEQIDSWVRRYGVSRDEFVICGHDDNKNPEIRAKFSNQETPEVVPKNARFVFYSQSYLQRCRHHDLTLENGGTFGRIVLDEFCLHKSLIPTFDYQYSRVLDESAIKTGKTNYQNWLRRNYSNGDINAMKKALFDHKEGFVEAHWLRTATVPVMFLTSEEISSLLLGSLGFEVYHHGVTEFTDCTINVEPANYLNGLFYNKMNTGSVWQEFDYDYIISNKINSYYQQSTEVLKRPVAVPHIVAKGSNDYRNTKILTIISNIPDKAIRVIRDVFKFYGKKYTFEEVKGLYYKSVLLQSIGRVLGYRGSKVTDVIIHSSIWEAVKNNVNLPYKINDSWVLDFKGKDDVIRYVNVTKNVVSEKKDNPCKQLVSYKVLSKHFKKDPDSVLTVSQIKEYLKQHRILNKSGTNALQASRLADFFEVEMGRKLIKGKLSRCVLGLRFANESSN
jgi:hypothetical protein